MNNKTAKMLRRMSEMTDVSYKALKKEWKNLPDEVKSKIRATGV